MPITIELEDGEAALVIRNDGEHEMYVPAIEDDEEVAYNSPVCMITKAAMAISDVEIATMLQARLEADLEAEAELEAKKKD